MIEQILLPEKIGSYQLFGKRVVGIEITKTHVYATVAYFKGSHITIEQCIEAPIEQHNGETALVRTGAALKKIFALVGKYNEIRFAASSAQVVFKTMQMPFNEIDKIKRVVDFEVEPLLPFSIADGIIDFIITKSKPEQQSCEILVAAVQKQYVSQQLELFTQIGITPDVITIDLFELYGLYHMIHQANSENAVLIELSSDATKIIFIAEGQLRFLRTLPVGTESTKNNNDAYTDTISIEEAPENVAVASEPFSNAKTLVENLFFTLQSFTTQTSLMQNPPTLYILGAGAIIPGLAPWLQQTLKMPVAIFNPTRITENSAITLKSMQQIPIANTISTAAAITPAITEYINFRQKEFMPRSDKLLLKQLICAALLFALPLTGLLVHSFLQKRKLRNELNASKAQTAALLSEWFPSIDKAPIDDMLEDADNETKKDERIWFAFARSAHNSLLNLLLELTKINREGLGLNVEKISIDQERGTMQLKANVKDHEALARLENELKQSKLFSYVEPQNNINFTMELRFAGERQGES